MRWPWARTVRIDPAARAARADSVDRLHEVKARQRDFDAVAAASAATVDRLAAAVEAAMIRRRR